MFMYSNLESSCILWFTSCNLLTVLWAFVIGLLATMLHEIVIVVISIRKGADLLVGVILEICHLHPKVRIIAGGDGPKDFLTDALCIAILEAASCGLLTVSTRVGGVLEVLPDDMVVLAEPISSDMVKAIPKAIYILSKIDLEVIHFHVSDFT
ncbi:hypothetical protein GIB67_032637 [Kingdonia uniflora]|uniref:Uncharacterized protein n=1 Tax=Kingdonia uniflora TaxID=39325 RepID=A0A7J7PA44_9MAGN|nr:hypothetical protein GIB67_032637 [Kingdonia uniflora]